MLLPIASPARTALPAEVLTKLALMGAKAWVEWREVKDGLGWFFVPKGQEDSAQGFNPGNGT
jgi:hypothetical protein